MSKSSIHDAMRKRMNWVILFFLIASSSLLARLFILQIVHHKDYVNLASKQHTVMREIFPERGVIFVQDKFSSFLPLAFNKIWKNIIVSPKDIENKEEIAKLLSEKFGLPEEEIAKKLSAENDSYEVIIKKVESEKIESLGLEKIRGIYLSEDKLRVYPHRNLAAHVLGFVSVENQEEEGRYGTEFLYEKDLTGEKGMFEGARDAAGFWIALGRRIIQPPKNGSDLYLTLDYNIQIKAEEEAEKLKDKWLASSVSVIVYEPKTGKIRALAVSPNFDPNEYYKEQDLSIFMNPVVQSMFELGSVLKPITMAGALEEGVVTSNSTYYDNGIVKIGGYTVRNFDEASYHTQSMTQVIEKSLNTGIVYVSRLLGTKRHQQYLKNFGFGQKTGVDLPGEIRGDISNLDSGREIDFATASFGQGIAVTPIQMARAMGAIANEGKLMKPYILEKIVSDSGNEIIKQPEEVKQVISKETAETITKMLVSAVRNGFENKAGVDGYFIAGKTGTAQIPYPDRVGYSDEVIHTFVGYAPAFNPKFLIYLQLNKPIGNRFAANTLTPAFHDLAEFILNYYEVPPDEK